MTVASVSRLKGHESSRLLVIVILSLVPMRRLVVAAHVAMSAISVGLFGSCSIPVDEG